MTVSFGGASTHVAVAVAITNAPPKFDPVTAFTVAAGETRSVSLKATSPFDYSVTLRSLELPAFARFDPGPAGTGVLVLTPRATDTGSHTVEIIAEDRGAPPLVSSTVVSFTVLPAGTSSAPRIEVSPASLDFGTVNIGQTKDLTLTVRNNGNATLTVTAIGSSNPRFALAILSTPFNVGGGSFQDVVIRFSPNSAGAQSGTLSIASNDASQPTITVPLSGTGSVAANRCGFHSFRRH